MVPRTGFEPAQPSRSTKYVYLNSITWALAGNRGIEPQHRITASICFRGSNCPRQFDFPYKCNRLRPNLLAQYIELPSAAAHGKLSFFRITQPFSLKLFNT
jgi:hypothetical protein